MSPSVCACHPLLCPQFALQGLNLAMIIFSALMIWKTLCVVTYSESPVVVVLRCACPTFVRSACGGDLDAGGGVVGSCSLPVEA